MARLKKYNPLRVYRKRIADRKRAKNPRIAVIGSGSWATALVKILLNNSSKINWYIRNPEMIEFIKTNHHNPKYLNYVTLDTNKLNFYSDIKTIVEESDVLFFAIPSAFLKESIENKNINWEGKLVVSAIKGIVPNENLTITHYFELKQNISPNNIAVISGPCHAEEIALEKLSYLTIACPRISRIYHIAGLIRCKYVNTFVSKDIEGIEYAAILKNIIAIGAGICHGLGYGDNFQAVYVSNAIREMKRFLDDLKRSNRQIDSSAYLGDLLVTSYSQFSRNRTLGTMIGKGYSVQTAILEMNMIAEGYFASKCIFEMKKKMRIETPIIDAVYKILYQNKPAAEIIEALTKEMH
jgi:glycerol-3-phosphate dehydrogenase (NAD(P)+)